MKNIDKIRERCSSSVSLDISETGGIMQSHPVHGVVPYNAFSHTSDVYKYPVSCSLFRGFSYILTYKEANIPEIKRFLLEGIENFRSWLCSDRIDSILSGDFGEEIAGVLLKMLDEGILFVSFLDSAMGAHAYYDKKYININFKFEFSKEDISSFFHEMLHIVSNHLRNHASNIPEFEGKNLYSVMEGAQKLEKAEDINREVEGFPEIKFYEEYNHEFFKAFFMKVMGADMWNEFSELVKSYEGSALSMLMGYSGYELIFEAVNQYIIPPAKSLPRAFGVEALKIERFYNKMVGLIGKEKVKQFFLRLYLPNLKHMTSPDHIDLVVRTLYKEVDRVVSAKSLSREKYEEEFLKLLSFRYPSDVYMNIELVRCIAVLWMHRRYNAKALSYYYLLVKNKSGDGKVVPAGYKNLFIIKSSRKEEIKKILLGIFN